MQVEEYIELWKNIGINNVDDYHRSLRDKTIWKPEFFDHFHPSKMNYKNFWKASDIHFGLDPVTNFHNREKNNWTIIKQVSSANTRNYKNIRNYGMENYLQGMTEYLLECRYVIPKLLEIGPGWGSLKDNFVDKNPDIEYVGFDLISRFPGVVEVEGDDGTLSDGQVDEWKGKFNMAFCSNVFQHLNKFQIKKYIDQVYSLLTDRYTTGFVAMFCLKREDCPTSFHYGQIVELPTYGELLEMFRGKFSICIESRMKNGFDCVVFHLNKILPNESGL